MVFGFWSNQKRCLFGFQRKSVCVCGRKFLSLLLVFFYFVWVWGNKKKIIWCFRKKINFGEKNMGLSHSKFIPNQNYVSNQKYLFQIEIFVPCLKICVISKKICPNSKICLKPKNLHQAQKFVSIPPKFASKTKVCLKPQICLKPKNVSDPKIFLNPQNLHNLQKFASNPKMCSFQKFASNPENCSKPQNFPQIQVYLKPKKIFI